MTINTTIFDTKAPIIMGKLMQDFPWTELDAAACVGNLGHESAGFTAMQEIKPTVAGSRGGFGWAQWTGPRRRAFEAYCQRHNLDPRSDRANYAYLFVELSGSEKAAIRATSDAKTLASKVIAFEQHFERAGVKHYDSRLQWAQRALTAYRASEHVPPPPVEPEHVVATVPGVDKPMMESTTVWASVSTMASPIIGAMYGIDWKVALPLIVVGGALAFWIIRQRMKARTAQQEAVALARATTGLPKAPTELSKADA